MKAFFTSLPGIVSIVGLILLVVPILNLGGAAAIGGDTRTTMQVFISLIVLAAALFVILSKKYESDTQKWAFGIVGTVVGYWLPSAV